MIIVEQSLNVAAAIADRAVFMEKGQVRFEGPIPDLMERDDLARAVFLGGEVPAVMLAVAWVNTQIVFDGIVQGLAIAVIAVGVVLIYRATRIINFAVGNMGVVGAATLSLLVLQYHVPFWVALVIALLIGLVFGAAGRDDGHPAAEERAAGGRAGRRPSASPGWPRPSPSRSPSPSDASAHYPSGIQRVLDTGRASTSGAPTWPS